VTADEWAWLGTRIEGDHRLREVLTRAFVEELMAVEVEARCRTETGERVNRRNGYRAGAFAMPSGSIPVRVPKLRHGGYAPRWLADGAVAAEDVLVASLSRGYVEGMSCDLVASLVDAMGVDELSTAQVTTLAAAMNVRIVAEHARPLPEVHGDDVTIETRNDDEEGEAISVATTSANGAPELLGLVVGPDADAAEHELRRDLTTRGLRGDVVRTGAARVARSRPAVTIMVRDHGRHIDDDPDSDETERPRRRRIPVLIAAVVGLLLIIAVVVGSSAAGRFGSDLPPPPTDSPAATAVPAAPATTAAAVTTAPAPAAPDPAAVAVVAPAPVPANCSAERVPWMDQVQCEAVAGSPTG
jgi:hypothetical protein